MIKPLLRGFLAAVTACLVCVVSQASAQYDVLELPASSLDSLYPGTCAGENGCFPSLIPSGTCAGGTTLGFTGSETHVAWKGEYFPSNPLGIVVNYGSPHPAVNLDFYQDGLTGTYFWFMEIPGNTVEGYDPLVWSDTSWIDYSLFTVVPDLSGTHDIFLQTSCGGPGCGNFCQFDFIFDVSGVSRPELAARSRVVSRGVSLLNLVGQRAKATVAPSTYYDMRGRAMTQVPSAGKGLVIVRPLAK